MKDLLSIIIVNYRSWEVLDENLKLLVGYEYQNFDTEIIVVDNKSDDGQLTVFEKKYPKVHFFLNSGNHGFAHACHSGFGISRGQLVLFLNPDTLAPQKAIEEMWQFYMHNSDAGIVSCIQSDKPSSYQKTPPGLFTLFGPLRSIYKFIHSKKYKKQNCKLCNCKAIETAWVSGSVVMISREVYHDAGGWNPDYWMYWEDVELSEKVKKSGKKLYMLCNINIEHKHGGASRKNIKTAALTKTEVMISQHVFFDRNTSGFLKTMIHTILIINNLFFKFLLSIPAYFFYFIPKMQIQLLIFQNLIKYYLKVIKTGSWKSERAFLNQSKS